MEPGVQTPEETLTQRRSGSCRDTGWLLVQMLRHLGLAARFVSGYLIQLKRRREVARRPVRHRKPTSPTCTPGARSTCPAPAGSDSIRPPACSPAKATSRSPARRSPSSPRRSPARSTNARSSSSTRMKVDAHLGGAARHQALHRRAVGRDRGARPPHRRGPASPTTCASPGRRADLRLGRRPRRRRVEHRGAGPDQAQLRGRAARPAAARNTRRSGLLHFGQGKWYPGEQLPRWSLNLLLAQGRRADLDRPGAVRRRERRLRRHRGAGAARSSHGVARSASASTRSYVFPAYEDTWYYLWRERRLPVNVDPFDSRLDDALERERLRKVFTAGPGQGRRPRAAGGARHRRTVALAAPARWFLRGERCYLVPGDSPMGYRLPLDSQPWVGDGRLSLGARARSDAAVSAAAARAPMLSRRPRGPEQPAGRRTPQPRARPARAQPRAASVRQRSPTPARPRCSSPPPTSRAPRCAPSRATGRLYVFMPPTAALEDYLELVAAIEATARRCALPVVLEGYEPPRDPRLDDPARHARPRRDRGQHPSGGAAGTSSSTRRRILYDAAHETRLSTEKFMLDGRHTGTGGGNHFVLGGATPADSPFLRRPDLLRSLIAYWHNHPSLSYLFSGLFIGPTSQAPRVDEARNDSVYELEIAFARARARCRPSGRRAAALAGRPPVAQPADRRHRQHASRRVLHRQAVLARRRRPAGSACSRCAPSRCRRTRA